MRTTKNSRPCRSIRMAQRACLMLTIQAAVVAAQPPIATTLFIVGEEDEPNVCALNGVCPGQPGVPLGATITQLPATGTGQLQQHDGTPIVSAPTAVTDVLRRVRYVPSTNDNGTPWSSFSYTLTNAISGEVSPVQSVAVNVTPVNDPPTLALSFSGIEPGFYEDTPRLVRLIVDDPDLSREGDTLTPIIVAPTSPLFMTMYQVGPDNVTPGAPIAIGDAVTNADHWVYLANFGANYWGNSANLVWKVRDAAGAEFPVNYTHLEHVNVLPVNDPPFANNVVMQGTQLYPVFAFGLSYGDIDTPLNLLEVTFTQLPTHGELYKNSIAPENLITPGNNAVPGGTPMIYKKVADGLGTPFDHCQYTVSDAEYTTEPGTATINYVYENIPPQPDPPPAVTVLEDSGVNLITLTATDPDSPPDQTRFYITKLPTRGKLHVLNILGTAWVPVVVPNTLACPFGPVVSVRYTPDPGANTLGGPPDTFEFKVSDNEDEYYQHISVPITITAVNDAPVITGPAVSLAHITVPGGQHVNAVVTTLSVSDDAGDQPISVSITSTLASSLVLNSTAGLTDFQQPTPASMTFKGTVNAVNAAFAAGLQFDPVAHGSGSITVSVSDLGNTGEESPPAVLTGTFQIVVPVVP